MSDSATPEQHEYLHAWSLRCHPFEQELDPQFFYAGSALMQRLDLLTHLVQFGESMVIVSGPAGSGKSTLLAQFLGHINPQWTVCLMDSAHDNQLSKRMSEALGGPASDDPASLLSRWAAQSEASQHVVIVIDNADQLDEATRQALCELTCQPDSERLRVVLFGTADTEAHIRATLEQIDGKRASQVLEVPKLSEEETAAYLMYRLAVAGYSGESPFTLTEVRAMCKAADGRPGAINRLAHESLIEHHARARNKKRAPLPRGAKKSAATLWIGASVVIAVIAGYLGWQRLAPTLEPDRSLAPTPPRLEERPLALPETPLPVEDAPSQVARYAADVEADTRAATTPAQDETPAPGNSPAPAATADSPAGAARSATDTADATASPATAPVASAPSTVAATTPAKTADASTPETAPRATLETPDAASVQPRTLAATPVTTPGVATAPPTPAKPAATRSRPDSAAAPAPVKPGPGQPHREDWLLQQAPDAFTLQLLGSRDPASIIAYIREHGLSPQQAAFYRGLYRNADWYVLVYGIYPDKAAALAARKTLPGKVRADKPWPRSLKSVQGSIRAAQ